MTWPLLFTKHFGKYVNMSRAILLSGGMDSIALSYWLKPDIAITIDYGQLPAKAEISSAKQISKQLGIKHFTISIDCRNLGSGNLAGKDAINVAPTKEWWPYRNQLLVTLASMHAVNLGVKEIIVGSVESDKTHVDGKFEFYQKLDEVVALQERNIRVTCPAIHLKSHELIQKSKIPKSLLLWAHSCHVSNIPCGECNGCKKYLYTMQQLGFD